MFNLLLSFLGGYTYNILGDEMIKNISVQDLKNIYEKINIIDIRGIESYNNNHMPGAKNVSFDDLLIRPDNYLSKNLVYYIYCQHGKKSLKLCQILKPLGYNVVNINGGYEAWILNK